MKKGFTMIELIFVIVILGILAAVAIPRLSATRDDAEAVKAATNLSTIISDLGAYYTSQGAFADDLAQMTNVQLTAAVEGKDGGEGATGNLAAAGTDCLTIVLHKAVPINESEVGSGKPAHIAVTGINNNNAICKKIHSMGSIDKILNGKFKYPAVKTAKTSNSAAVIEDADSNNGEFAVSGMSVKF
ncbi:prepilin-type N-terminal cleavage/methylation domain-containing protein [Campylobacter sp. RM12327]|uniref:type II secretion system protein n=1 Tax=Campylobacter sputorum TaxID=206 RepID=UPI000B7881C2|nr:MULTISPECIES: prepilin-type N-terminal cleavage/methylation domain-containing protein [Campylobacter]ASM39887.1 putative type II secretion system protein [Campylobacter sputorum]MBE7357537.1 prepilin-type N-terminal cleavage/methylation domain-containing protein [Campylobacter sp. RM11302]MBF6669162.1 prepilin-type N-terminal cleavage/methylation domain-containing protein [Campylobacter sp. RM12327]MBF6674362.1 prepilin-type N-terminal cleavage/methylation domain-containing protein [Campylob